MKAILLFLVLSILFSCQYQQSEKPEIRFVNQKGKSRNLEIRKFDSYQSEQIAEKETKNSNFPAQKDAKNLESLDFSYTAKNPQITKLQAQSQDQSQQNPNYSQDNPSLNSNKNSQAYPKNLSPGDSFSYLDQPNQIIYKKPSTPAQNNLENVVSNEESKPFEEKISEREVDLTNFKDEESKKVNINSSQGSQENFVNSESRNEVIFKNNSRDEKSDSRAIFGKKEKRSKASSTFDKSSTATKEAKNKSGLNYYLQIGSFSSKNRAIETVDKMNDYGQGKVEIAEFNNKKIYRSLLGPYVSKIQAKNIAAQIKETGQEALIITSK